MVHGKGWKEEMEGGNDVIIFSYFNFKTIKKYLQPGDFDPRHLPPFATEEKQNNIYYRTVITPN